MPRFQTPYQFPIDTSSSRQSSSQHMQMHVGFSAATEQCLVASTPSGSSPLVMSTNLISTLPFCNLHFRKPTYVASVLAVPPLPSPQTPLETHLPGRQLRLRPLLPRQLLLRLVTLLGRVAAQPCRRTRSGAAAAPDVRAGCTCHLHGRNRGEGWSVWGRRCTENTAGDQQWTVLETEW